MFSWVTWIFLSLQLSLGISYFMLVVFINLKDSQYLLSCLFYSSCSYDPLEKALASFKVTSYTKTETYLRKWSISPTVAGRVCSGVSQTKNFWRERGSLMTWWERVRYSELVFILDCSCQRKGNGKRPVRRLTAVEHLLSASLYRCLLLDCLIMSFWYIRTGLSNLQEIFD